MERQVFALDRPGDVGGHHFEVVGRVGHEAVELLEHPGRAELAAGVAFLVGRQACPVGAGGPVLEVVFGRRMLSVDRRLQGRVAVGDVRRRDQREDRRDRFGREGQVFGDPGASAFFPVRDESGVIQGVRLEAFDIDFRRDVGGAAADVDVGREAGFVVRDVDELRVDIAPVFEVLAGGER